MGTQINISHAEMLKHGCTFEDTSESFPEGDGRSVTFYNRVYTIPGYGVWKSYSPHSFYIDFNDWGNNKPRLQPWLDTNQVEYILG